MKTSTELFFTVHSHTHKSFRETQPLASYFMGPPICFSFIFSIHSLLCVCVCWLVVFYSDKTSPAQIKWQATAIKPALYHYNMRVNVVFCLPERNNRMRNENEREREREGDSVERGQHIGTHRQPMATTCTTPNRAKMHRPSFPSVHLERAHMRLTNGWEVEFDWPTPPGWCGSNTQLGFFILFRIFIWDSHLRYPI